MPFPRVVDYHKRGRPSVPSGYGIFYAIVSVCYWFLLSFIGVSSSEALLLAASVLFGGIMGLFDDVANLRWRYKAILPVFASLPYIALVPHGRTTVSLLAAYPVELGALFLILLVPVIVTVVTNSYNQLGGLNGLEAGTGLFVAVGLTAMSGSWVLLGVPILVLAALTLLSFSGKAFVGNVGSFSVGLTLAVVATLYNLKLMLLIAFIPFIVNSLLILYSNYIIHDRADTVLGRDGKLRTRKVRSLRTLILRYKPMTERQTVVVIYLLVILFTVMGGVLKPLLYP
jgi:UDP-N-acetylglucosamine--dolichyl-phosphate N-acetylglucosaminephosphotransferase